MVHCAKAANGRTACRRYAANLVAAEHIPAGRELLAEEAPHVTAGGDGCPDVAVTFDGAGPSLQFDGAGGAGAAIWTRQGTRWDKGHHRRRLQAG
eukprot:15460859-Alexandrium_andersonii.AAC.1